MATIKAPFGKPDYRTVDAPTAAGQDLAINSNDTVIKLTGMTGATTINAVADDQLEAGARLVVHAVQGGTGRNVTLGTGFTGPNLTGVANDEDLVEFVYDGTNFVALSAWYKVVDAA